MSGPLIFAESGRTLTHEQLLEELEYHGPGVVVLDGYSFCGKTYTLRKLAGRVGKMKILSYRDVTEDLCAAMRWGCAHRPEAMGFFGAEVYAVEDLDYLRWKEFTQKELAALFQRISQNHLLIITGNGLDTYVPHLMSRIYPRTKYLFVHPSIPEAWKRLGGEKS